MNIQFDIAFIFYFATVNGKAYGENLLERAIPGKYKSCVALKHRNLSINK
jgi:hypothetical protein